jgi:hypothetical protein
MAISLILPYLRMAVFCDFFLIGRGTAFRRAFENCMNSKGFEKKYREKKLR